MVPPGFSYWEVQIRQRLCRKNRCPSHASAACLIQLVSALRCFYTFPQKALNRGQQEFKMWNAMHGKSLAGAVLISVAMQGSLLWRFNQLASDGAASQTPEATPSVVVAAAPQTPPAVREVTLEPVVIVGRREAAPSEPDIALASTQAVEPATRSQRVQHGLHM
jgi:hypothetical protein